MKKTIVIGILLLCVSASVASAFNVLTTKSPPPLDRGGTWLYVGGTGPGNYTTINGALNAAHGGDTIFVYKKTYHENVLVNKSITLLGENKMTIIDGNANGSVVSLYARDITVSGFTLRNCGNAYGDAGIKIYSDHNCITNTIVEDNHFYGIRLEQSDSNTITNTIVRRSQDNGVDLYGSNNNTVLNNTITDNHFGGLEMHHGCRNNIISGYNIIESNIDDGIRIREVNTNNIISSNMIAKNGGYGLRTLYAGARDNLIYNNYFDNTRNYLDDNHNRWNTSKKPGKNIIGGPYLGGNYWSDYTGKDTNGDGLGDTNIPYGPGDYLPLVRMNSPPVAHFTYTPTNPTIMTIISFTDTSTDTDGYITSWLWNFGDETSSTEQHPTHTYPTAGIYNVTLSVTDNNGATNSTTTTIIVADLPDLAITDITVTHNVYSITITAIVQNQGGADITVPFKTTLYGAYKWSVTPYEYPLYTQETKSLAAGATAKISQTFIKLPPYYYVSAITDTAHSIMESNENNNKMFKVFMKMGIEDVKPSIE